MTELYSTSKYDEAMASRDEEQLQPLNPPPMYNSAFKPCTGAVNVPPVTSTGGTHIQYLPVGTGEEVTVGTGQGPVQVMVVPNQQVRGMIQSGL